MAASSEEKSRTPIALVVEDDESIVQILSYILARDGYDVHVATDGLQAQQIMAEIAEPAIITLDVMLAHADGYRLLEIIRARPEWSNVPVIMLTAKSQEQDIVRALDGGANDFLVKPFKPEEFRARVKRLVRQRP